jgi:hypothetical protein
VPGITSEMWWIHPLLLAGALPSITASAIIASSSAGLFYDAFETVQTVGGTTSLENLAIRHSDDILVTSTSSGALYQIRPRNDMPPVLVAKMDDASGLLGIVELQRDIFYVAGSNISERVAAPGSNRVWRIDMRCFKMSPDGIVLHPASATLVARLPDAMLLNGMSRLSLDDDAHLLIADSVAGSIIKLNVYTGRHSVFSNDSTMAPSPTGLGLGINGIHVQDATVYYTSLDQGLFASIEISHETGLPRGSAQIIARGIVAGDDFALSPDGTKAFVANNGEFTITEVDIPGRFATVVANSSFLQASSAVASAGKDHPGRIPLYVTGAMSLSGNETVGRVVKAYLKSP